MILFNLLVAACGFTGDTAYASKKSSTDLQPGKINPELAKIAYSGGEMFKYDVSWTGGIKVGEIYLSVNRINRCDECFEIDSIITTSDGIIHALYPVKDRHITKVQGPDRLPYFCEIWQQQGRNYRAHKIFQYDQKNYTITKRKEGSKEKLYELEGIVHNEFSSFFSSRLMNLDVNKPFLVPTFGDDRRNEVVVETIEEVVLKETVFGDVAAIKVTPILTFSGLYDKQGDTTIYYTDDECRVPVLIHSRIVIGSLTANLAKYSNPLCMRYHGLSEDDKSISTTDISQIN